MDKNASSSSGDFNIWEDRKGSDSEYSDKNDGLNKEERRLKKKKESEQNLERFQMLFQ